jgi:hypothetical protein
MAPRWLSIDSCPAADGETLRSRCGTEVAVLVWTSVSTDAVEDFTTLTNLYRLAVMAWQRMRPHRRRPTASTTLPPPDPGNGAWLRRNPAGGWNLNLRRRHLSDHHQCATMSEAATLIARDAGVSNVYLWSESRGSFVHLDLPSLCPLLEELQAAS